MVKICLVNAATHRIAVQLDHRADRHPARIQSALNQRVVSSLLRQTGGRLFALSFLPLIRIFNKVLVPCQASHLINALSRHTLSEWLEQHDSSNYRTTNEVL